MAVSFQIDSVTMPLDPYEVDWGEKDVIDRTHAGAPIFNVKRTIRLRFDDMTFANFGTFLGYDDGATHTIKIPADASGTYTNYAGAYWRKVAGQLADLNVYGAEFEASWVEV